MTSISEDNKAIAYYLERLKNGPENDKRIQNIINQRFNVSAASIRNKLIADGVIELKVTGYDNKRLRNIFEVRLVNKDKVKFVPEKVVQSKSVVIETHWPEGWPKSRNNAFDWKNTAQGLFSKAEMAAMQAKIKANPSFTQTTNVYSRA
jgi:uncharacterized protein (UPF0335 family)